jgi:non-ribosomal peptide synthase protein (TIGR01720 family)
VHKCLDIETGPLVRAEYFHLGPARPPRVLIAIHHLAVDGVSWRTLLEDLNLAVEQLDRGQKIQLFPKTTSYQEWARRLRQYAESRAMDEDASFWLSLPNGPLEPFPEDDPRGANTVASSDTIVVRLDAARTESLLKDTSAAYRARIDEVLVTALVHAYCRWSGKGRLLVDLEGHGRQPLWEDVDLTRTVGWFTSLYPAVLSVEADSGPAEAIHAVKEQLRAIPQQGIGYGILRYLREGPIAQRLAAQPQASVVFNYLGQLDVGAGGREGLFLGATLAQGLSQSPESVRSHAVEITAYVSQGRLCVEWNYSRNRHRRETIRKWALGFVESLEQLVAHCQDPAACRYTPSDFPAARVSEKDLQKLLAKLRSQDGKPEA